MQKITNEVQARKASQSEMSIFNGHGRTSYHAHKFDITYYDAYCNTSVLYFRLRLQLKLQTHAALTLQSRRNHWSVTVRNLSSSTSCMETNQMDKLTHVSSLYSPFHPFTRCNPALCYPLVHNWLMHGKPLRQKAWLIVCQKDEVIMSALLTKFATSWV